MQLQMRLCVHTILFFLSIIFFLIIFFNLGSLKSEEIANSIEADKIEYLNLDGNIKAIGSVKIIQNQIRLDQTKVKIKVKIQNRGLLI